MDQKQENLRAPDISSQKARHLIEKRKNSAEKTALYNSGLYPGLIVSSNTDFEIFDRKQAYRRNQLGCIYLIPDTLTLRIPLHPPFYIKLASWLNLSLPCRLDFLFLGDKLRYEFFQQEVTETLLRQERTSNQFCLWRISNTTPISSLATKLEWTKFTIFFEQLTTENHRLKATLKKLSPFFHWTNYRIFQAYQAWLKTTAQKALHQQIDQFSNYLKGLENQTMPINQKTVQMLLDKLESYNCEWEADLFLELATLRLAGAQLINLSCKNSNFSESASIFDKLYADLYKVIYEFEQSNSPLSLANQTFIQELKTILKESELDKNAKALRKKIAKYRTEKIKNESHTFLAGIWSTQSLATKLDIFLNQEQYDEDLLDAHQRAEMKEVMENFTETTQNSNPITSFNKKDTLDPSSLQALSTPFVQLGKTILYKEKIDLENDMASLNSEKSHPVNFTHQTFAYLYGFLSSLIEVPSKMNFTEKLIMFDQIIIALDTLTQGTPCNIKTLLSALKNSKKSLEEQYAPWQWKYFFTSFFIADYQALHKTYRTENRVEETSEFTAIPEPLAINNHTVSNFPFLHQ